jgi:hypothetical protein
MNLSIKELKSLDNNFLLMKTLTEFSLEKKCTDIISFRKFLVFPEYIPDSNKV